MKEEKKSEVIDLREFARRIVGSKKLFFKVWGITFLLACIWILPQPRYYTSSVVLAPESTSSIPTGTLGSLASNFGLNLGNASINSALYPMLYPDVIGSTNFIVGLFDLPIRTIDGEVSTNYYDYLQNYNKKSPWDYPFIWINKLKRQLFPPETYQNPDGDKSEGIDPFFLTREETDMVNKVSEKITCSVDKKTDVITISVTDQDPLVSATLADSVRNRLQQYIIDYRTSKARIDYQYYEKLTAEKKLAYEKKLNEYTHFAQRHTNLVLTTYIEERDRLQREMQYFYDTYQSMLTEMQLAAAKVQERTPSFTILQSATVPIKPAGPKRMIFVAAMLFLVTVGTVLYLFHKEVLKQSQHP